MSFDISLVVNAIGQSKSYFDDNNVLQFTTEEHFASQMLAANDFAMKVAMKNPNSVINAMRNVASIGLSLNPANSHAYLVPRGGEICLDISYMGLIALATQSGAIDFVFCEVVYENEQLLLNGFNQAPSHNFDPFNREGSIKGVYCVTKLAKGGVITTTMSRKDIDDIRALSPGSSKSSSPWNTFFGEMSKKCVIKRASKTWPVVSQRLLDAISYLNDEGSEGIHINKKKMRVIHDEPTQPQGNNVGNMSVSQEKIDKLVKMAFERGRVDNARQYFKDNFSGEDLEYALNKLKVN